MRADVSNGTPEKSSLTSLYPIPLLALLAAVLAYVFLSAPVTVTLDGYSHLYGGTALRWMWRGLEEAHSAFVYNSILLPNWVSAVGLAALSSVVSPELALELVIVATAILFLSSLYFCTAAAPAARHQRAQMLIALLPFTLNSFLLLGYFNFLISSSLCLFVLGLLIRHGLNMPLRLQCAGACLLLGAYAAHPFPVLISLLFPGAYVLADAVVHRRAGSLSSAAVLRKHALGAWPWLPPAFLIAWFSVRLMRVAPPQADPGAASVISRPLALVRETALSISPGASAGTANSHGTYPVTAWLSIALLALLLVGVLMRGRKSTERDPVRFTTLAVLVSSAMALSLFVPDRVGDGSGIVMRLVFHAALFLALLAFTSGTFPSRLLTLCSLVAALSVLGFARQYQLAARGLAPRVAEVRAAMEGLPRHSRILILGYRMTPLCEGGPLLKKTFPERHAALAGAIENELIVLNDYQAHTSHFPLRYVDGRYDAVVDEFDGYSASQREGWLDVLKSEPDVDYVVSWGVSGDAACRNTVSAPYEYTLSGAYERVLLEEGLSHVAVWRRRE